MKENLFPKYTIARKIVMALTGLGLIGFLVMHLAGNLLVFVSPDIFNEYSYKLISNPLIYVAEAILLILFIYHAVEAIVLKRLQLKARPIGYEEQESLGRRSVYSRSMLYTGIIVVVFVVVHVATMKFGIGIQDSFDAEHGRRDLFNVVAMVFANPIWVIFYLLCLLAVGFHVAHALQSSLRTLGLSERRMIDRMKSISLTLALVLVVGFSTIPIYFLFFYEVAQ